MYIPELFLDIMVVSKLSGNVDHYLVNSTSYESGLFRLKFKNKLNIRQIMLRLLAFVTEWVLVSFNELLK